MLAHVKSNDGPEMESLVYEIEPIVLPATGDEPEVSTSRLVLRGESPHSGRALLGVGVRRGEVSARDEAVEFLLAELEDGERHQAEELFRAAGKIGINIGRSACPRGDRRRDREGWLRTGLGMVAPEGDKRNAQTRIPPSRGQSTGAVPFLGHFAKRAIRRTPRPPRPRYRLARRTAPPS